MVKALVLTFVEHLHAAGHGKMYVASPSTAAEVLPTNACHYFSTVGVLNDISCYAVGWVVAAVYDDSKKGPPAMHAHMP